MDDSTLALGIFALLFGLYTCVARLKAPEKFGKLRAMKDKFGERAGTVIHVIAYTVVPIVAGIIFIVRASGVS